jgi:glyoxylase-like metal-dependent hydrolase (beta-lactamase superfamily II)
MKIFSLNDNSKIYTSNVFLVLGEWNGIEDVNTLIDVGCDHSIIPMIDIINTGLGKKKIDQVIITHSHSDHSGLLPVIKEVYKPVVYAFNPHLPGVDRILHDGDFIKIGEKQFEIYHITSHSFDSVCLYNEADGILFAGDTTFPIEFENKKLEEENKQVLLRLCGKKVTRIYYGHGAMIEFSNKPFRLKKNGFGLEKGCIEQYY